MKILVLSLMAVATIATAAISPAEARWRGGWGPGIELGIATGAPTDPMVTTDRVMAITVQGIMLDRGIIVMAMPARVIINTTE
jgi:hypothetical protein